MTEQFATPRPDDATRKPEHRDDAAAQLYETLFNQFPDGILIIDTNGSFIDFNEAAHRDLGYTREEFARLRISDIDPVHTPEDIGASIAEVTRMGGADFEVKHRAKDGAIRDVQVIARHMTLSGEPVFCTIWRDVTEKNRAAAALTEAGAKYRDLFENANDAIFIVDADQNFFDVNRRATELFGYSREEFLSMNVRDFIPPTQRAASEREFRKLLEEGAYEKFVGKSRTKDGRWLDVEVNSSAIVKNGKLVGSRDIVRDITDRKRAEDALRASENLLQTIIETEPACVKLLDAEGRLLMMNRAGLSMIEAESLDQVKGKPLYDMVAPEFRDAFKTSVDDVFKGISGMLEFEMIGLKGRRVRLETHAVPLRNDNHEISALLGVTRDITERKKLEAELMRAQKLESLGFLAGGIAHDFNNLLTAILGNISLAKMEVGGDHADVCSVLAEAEGACLRARDLTLQLLTFARGGAPVKTTTSISNVIRETARFALRGSAVRCDLQIPADLRPVDIDQGQMSQVIHNLVINAEQSMPEGGTITISCENVSVPRESAGTSALLKPGDYVLIAVQDHGVGLAREHLAKVFDPYFTTKQKGSGLGLATCYSIVTRHGGHITVDSESGVGTTFSIYLPASRQVLAKQVSDLPVPVSGSGRILVMDDEAAVRDVASAILRKLGYDVVVAADGTEAIRFYTAARDTGRAFDAVIMDLTVPGGMGGKDAVKHLIAIDPSVRAIVSSGYSKDQTMADYRRYGFVGVIAKPYTLTGLSAAVGAVLATRA